MIGSAFGLCYLFDDHTHNPGITSYHGEYMSKLDGAGKSHNAAESTPPAELTMPRAIHEDRPQVALINGGINNNPRNDKVEQTQLAKELEARAKLLGDAARYISNRNPAVPLDQFPERGRLLFRQISLIQLYNAVTGGKLPINEHSYDNLGRSRGIIRTLVSDQYWDATQSQESWKRKLKSAEACIIAQELNEKLAGRIATEADCHFGSANAFCVDKVKSKGQSIEITGATPDGKPRSWSIDVSLLEITWHEKKVTISGQYLGTLEVALS